jgi:hypothetical protein
MFIEPKVRFEEDTHSYYIDGKKAVSVSKVVSFFKEPMDEGYWQTYKALEKIFPNFKDLKNERYSYPYNSKPPTEFLIELITSVKPEIFFEAKCEVKQEWLDSQTNGTAFHNEMENDYFNNGYVINPWGGKKFQCIKYDKIYDNQSLCDNLYELEDGAYPELLLWNEKFRIGGQSDLVFLDTENSIRYSDVDDHKTNKKKPTNSSNRNMSNPISHLKDSKLMGYNLQMTLYQRMLELMGFTPRYTSLTHYKDYDKRKGSRIELKYLRDEADSMMEAYRIANPIED